MKELLTVQELAEYLKINPRTIRSKAGKGEIPAIKFARQFRFDKEQIDTWLSHKAVANPLHILVVDDELLVGKLFEESLNKSNYRVKTTLSSLEALELIGNEQFDLIFLDLLMPEIDGAEVFRQIRLVDKQIPVVIITGYPESEVMRKAMEIGPFMVLKKPFTGDDILNTIQSFVEGVAIIRRA
ncbi:response regulator [Chloroflexota bacterium]